MEFIFLLIAIIFIFSLFSSSENRQYTEEDDEDEYEDNFCAPTKYNPANGAPITVSSADMGLGLYHMTTQRSSIQEMKTLGEGLIS